MDEVRGRGGGSAAVDGVADVVAASVGDVLGCAGGLREDDHRGRFVVAAFAGADLFTKLLVAASIDH